MIIVSDNVALINKYFGVISNYGMEEIRYIIKFLFNIQIVEIVKYEKPSTSEIQIH